MSDAIMEARARIREGDRIATRWSSRPPFRRWSSVGDRDRRRVCALDAMLAKIADFMKMESMQPWRRFAAAIEPVLIVFWCRRRLITLSRWSRWTRTHLPRRPDETRRAMALPQ